LWISDGAFSQRCKIPRDAFRVSLAHQEGEVVMHSTDVSLPSLQLNEQRRFLTQRQISMIDEALASVGDFGEVRLVVQKGRLRFLVTQKSYDALQWQPGTVPEGLD
jgi:hypothetical protein